MMDVPNFINSPYFVMEDENWHLKEGAPQEVIEEFEAFMKKAGRETVKA